MKGFEELEGILCKRRQGESCRRKGAREDCMKEDEELERILYKGRKGESWR